MKLFAVKLGLTKCLLLIAVLPSLLFAEVEHKYVIKVWNIKGNLIEKVKIHYILKENRKICVDTTVELDQGSLFIKWNPKPDPEISSMEWYSTALEYEVNKDGYFSERNFSSCRAGVDDLDNFKVSEVKLLCAADYFKEGMINATNNNKLRNQIAAILERLRVKSVLSDVILETNSIDKIIFKDRAYLCLQLSSTTSYNSLRLNKYEIARKLFDEIIRSVLDPLNDQLKKSSEISGYDIGVVGFTKDFSDEYSTSKAIQYRFLMPKDKVESYKNKDITGQQLIDQSVVLMDDERIDLKLQ